MGNKFHLPKRKKKPQIEEKAVFLIYLPHGTILFDAKFGKKKSQ